jgi:hypothetical protein
MVGQFLTVYSVQIKKNSKPLDLPTFYCIIISHGWPLRKPSESGAQADLAIRLRRMGVQTPSKQGPNLLSGLHYSHYSKSLWQRKQTLLLGRRTISMADLTLGLDLGPNSIGWALIDEAAGLIIGVGATLKAGKSRRMRSVAWQGPCAAKSLVDHAANGNCAGS